MVRNPLKNSNLLYSVDTSGVSIVTLKRDTSHYIRYPEAAVWLVMAENRWNRKTITMLGAILNMDESGAAN
jgi:hypothetical protein